MRSAVCAGALLVVTPFCVSACHAGADQRANASTPSTGAAPQQVNAQPGGGAAGTGPIVATNARNEVVLPDRTLKLNEATRHRIAGDDHTVAVRVAVTIENRSNVAIANAATFFSLIGAEGDISGSRPQHTASSSTVVPPHATTTRTMTFDIPTAAASNLQLLYHPAAGARTVVFPLRGV